MNIPWQQQQHHQQQQQPMPSGSAATMIASSSKTPLDTSRPMSPFYPFARLPAGYDPGSASTSASASASASSSSEASSLPTPEASKNQDVWNSFISVATDAHHAQQQQQQQQQQQGIQHQGSSMQAAKRGGSSHGEWHTGGCDDPGLVDVLFPRHHHRNGAVPPAECDKCDFHFDDSGHPTHITPSWCTDDHCSAAACCDASHHAAPTSSWKVSADPYVCDFQHHAAAAFDECCDPHGHHHLPMAGLPGMEPCPDAHCTTVAPATAGIVCPVDGQVVCTDPSCDESHATSAPAPPASTLDDACTICEHPSAGSSTSAAGDATAATTMDEAMQALWTCCHECSDGGGGFDLEACCRAFEQAGEMHCQAEHHQQTTTAATNTGGTSTPHGVLGDDACQFLVPHQHDSTGLCIDPCAVHHHAPSHLHSHSLSQTPMPAIMTQTCKWADCSFACASQDDLVQHVNDVHLRGMLPATAAAASNGQWPSSYSGNGNGSGASSSFASSPTQPMSGPAAAAAALCQWDSCNTQPNQHGGALSNAGLLSEQEAQAALLQHLLQSHIGPNTTPQTQATQQQQQQSCGDCTWPTPHYAPHHPQQHHQQQYSFRQHDAKAAALYTARPPLALQQQQQQQQHNPAKGLSLLSQAFATSNDATASTSSLAASPSTSSSSSALASSPPLGAAATSRFVPLVRNSREDDNDDDDEAIDALEATATGSTSAAPSSPTSTSATPGSHPCGWRNCTLTFPCHSTLTEHITTAHIGGGKSSYKCDWVGCQRALEGKEFAQRQKILRHVQTHTGHRPFKCTHCGRRFSEQNTLAQHVRTHTREKPYVCDHPNCGARFAVAGSLTIHKRSRHTKERPFACEFPGCGKRFAESSNLTKHRRTHSGDKPFACGVCGRGFSRPDQLQRHRRVHGGGEGQGGVGVGQQGVGVGQQGGQGQGQVNGDGGGRLGSDDGRGEVKRIKLGGAPQLQAHQQQMVPPPMAAAAAAAVGQ